ncbi:Paraslipin [Azospirillaceae bacterium]
MNVNAPYSSSIDSSLILAVCLVIFFFIIVFKGVKIVPQGEEHLVEQLGRYIKALKPGLTFIVPVLQYVSARVDMRERQRIQEKMQIITKDNVQIELDTTVFFRVIDSAKQHYRIANLSGAIDTTVQSTVRSTCGQLDFDEVQSRRDFINDRVREALADASQIWGVDITRTEVLDVKIQESTRVAMMQQMNSERERRARITEAEGKRDATKLEADGALYKAQREAEAIKLKADAEAYAAETIGKAIQNGGQAAIDFEIRKNQIIAVAKLADSDNTKLLVLPTDLTKALGSVVAVMEGLKA